MVEHIDKSAFDAAWRRPAPVARRLAMALYSWQEPGLVFLLGVVATMPFLFAAAFAPALLSLAPTVEMIAPIAEARAIAAGSAQLGGQATPFHALLLILSDIFADSPGRIHLVAKAIAAAVVAWPAAYFCVARFPALQTIMLSTALAAYVSAPFSGPAEIALAIFLGAAIALLCAPADEGAVRARIEGVLCGGLLSALWLMHPAFALAGFIALSASPFLTGRTGLLRYVFGLAVFIMLSLFTEFAAPGLNFARASSTFEVLSSGVVMPGESTLALAGVFVSGVVVILGSAVFGGPEHARGWAVGAGLCVVAFIAARLAGANAAPIFIVGAAFACLSVASPFYDGIFRDHDRASIAISTVVAGLVLFWTLVIIVHSAGQFALQHRVAREAPKDIRTELGLVQAGGPTIVRWIEEGRFSTPEARKLFALAPVEQSAMLLEAAAQARRLAAEGIEVAILTGADAACVLTARRTCSADGVEAAKAASVVFVPRLELDAATALAQGRSEVLLYTEFRLIGETAFWEVWVRRGALLPADFAGAFSPPR